MAIDSVNKFKTLWTNLNLEKENKKHVKKDRWREWVKKKWKKHTHIFVCSLYGKYQKVA